MNITTEYKYCLLKSYLFKLLFIISQVILANAYAFYLEGLMFYFRLFVYVLLFITFVLISTYKKTYTQIEPFIKTFTFATYLIVWYFVLCIWTVIPTVFFILFLFPLFNYTVASDKTATQWLFAVIITIILTLIIPKDIFSIVPIKQQATYGNLKLIASITVIYGFIFYYNNKIVKSLHPSDKEEQSPEKSADSEMRYKKVYDNLYHQIIDYFEKDKPWRNPDFSIHDLATKLNTNNTYISRAINYSSGMNFKTLVNKHRIEYIKNELLTDNVKKRYTLLYIYTSAGFRHQSTFNKAFKQIENMTPSEYILMLGNQELTTPIDLT